MTRPTFNPFDPAFRANPYPFYQALREQDPVHSTPLGSIILTRYEDVSATLRSNDFSRDIEATANEPTDPLWIAKRERRKGRDGAKTILNLDPPDHTRLRRLVSKAFTPTAIDRLRPRIQQLVDDVLDQASDNGGMELVDEMAFPIPFQVISDLLAMPTDRSDEMREWGQLITLALEPTSTLEDLDRTDEAFSQLIPYLFEIIEDRRRHPGDDLLSALIAVEDDGDNLALDELISFVVLLYIAGHETTVNLIGNSINALLRFPEQLALWHNNPSIATRAVDELLRFDGPVQQTVRVPIVPVTYQSLHGPVTVEPGTIVTTLLGAGNHDPAMFADPHILKLDRANSNRHLAFAGGIHYCLGASLAKLEAEIAVGSMVARFPNMHALGDITWRDRLTIRGVDHLQLEF
ncbi:MAG: cytochrome P450 [Ilumatobacteraceae bacterium]|nr:cytochrome P450 [Ilumatobacteraceae bacterium]